MRTPRWWSPTTSRGQVGLSRSRASSSLAAAWSMQPHHSRCGPDTGRYHVLKELLPGDWRPLLNQHSERQCVPSSESGAGEALTRGADEALLQSCLAASLELKAAANSLAAATGAVQSTIQGRTASALEVTHRYCHWLPAGRFGMRFLPFDLAAVCDSAAAAWGGTARAHLCRLTLFISRRP